MSGRHARYSAQEVLDFLDGNFAIPEDGFQSDIEGFESVSDDDLEPQMPPHEPENDEIDLRNAIIEDKEAEEEDNSSARVELNQDRGLWQRELYLHRKTSAGLSEVELQELLPQCVLDDTRKRYPNPPGVPYMGHKRA